MTEHEKTCDCLYCNSKCPECGSTKISVKYWPAFEYENDTRNNIHITRGIDQLELECLECGAWIKPWDGEQDKRLSRLQHALSKILDLPSGMTVPIDGDGGIKTESYKITGRVTSQKKKV